MLHAKQAPQERSDDDLDGSVEDELPELGALAKRDPEEYPEAPGGDQVVRGAAGDGDGGVDSCQDGMKPSMNPTATQGHYFISIFLSPDKGN